MGILDDAIREHLELKRQHGVPEEEVQRQEEEALGPARRDVAQQHDQAEATAGQPATAEADEPSVAESDGAEPAGASEETALFDMETPDEPGPVAEETTPDEPGPVAEEPPPVEPPPAEPPPAEPDFDEEEPVGEPGHDPEADEEEDPLAEDPEHADLDVLEDTPDFLQETPEHDRLWFEQKPPRDFDFD